MVYEIEEYENNIEIYDRNLGYSLKMNLSDDYCLEHQRIFFTYSNNDTGFLITARSINQYPKDINSFLSKPNLQYIEVGCGLGEFLPLIIQKKKQTSSLPIAIDPANYELMRDMLKYALTLNETKVINSNIDVLIDRINLFLDVRSIILLNKPLENIIDNHPKLIHFADGVVDNFGPHLYQTKFKNLTTRIECLEMRLLKHNGKLILG